MKTRHTIFRLACFLTLILATGGAAGGAAAADPPAHGLTYIELLTGGAQKDDRLPLIVAIHGLGDKPERFQGLLRDLPFPARVVVPRAPDPWNAGWSWFPTRRTVADEERIVAAIDRSARRVAALVAELARQHPTRGKPVVLGFSQGGILSFVVALLHPDAVGLAIPLGGWLPDPLTPTRKAPAGSALPPIRALHGAVDRVLRVENTQKAVDHLSALGYDVTLTTFPDVGHRVPAPMRSELFRLLRDYGSALEGAPE